MYNHTAVHNPLLKIRAGSNLEDFPSTPHPCSPEAPKPQCYPCPARCISGPCPHPGLAAEMLRRLWTSRGYESRMRWHGSKLVFLKGSFMPPTPARGSAAWQGSEEPIFNRWREGRERISLETSWSSALCRSVKGHPEGKGTRLSFSGQVPELGESALLPGTKVGSSGVLGGSGRGHRECGVSLACRKPPMHVPVRV